MPEKLILPNGTSLEDLSLSTESSCHNDRSFLIDELPITIDERLLYPVDEETRTPHLIRIFDEGSYKYGQYSCKEDYDHSWYYSSSPDLKDPGGKAVRNSMGQVIPRRIHKIKNSRFGGLVWLPHTNTEKFVATIAGITGVASRWAVDVRRPDNDLLVYLDDTEFEFIGLGLNPLVNDDHLIPAFIASWKAGTIPGFSSSVTITLAPAEMAFLTCATWFSTE